MQTKDSLGIHRWDSIWWPTVTTQQIIAQEEEEALKLHKKGVRMWDDLWDKVNNTWKNRADLIAEYNLPNSQLDLIGERLRQWNRSELWVTTISSPPNVKAFTWDDQKPIWPIPKALEYPTIHCVLNEKWHTLKDRYQWISVLQSLWNPFIETERHV